MADRGGGCKWSAPLPPYKRIFIVHAPNQLFRNKKEVEFKNKLTLHVGFQLDQGACLNQDEIWTKLFYHLTQVVNVLNITVSFTSTLDT